MSSVLIPNETKKKVVIKKKIVKKVKKRKDNEEHNETSNDEVIEAPLAVKEERKEEEENKEEPKKKKKKIVKKVIKKKKGESNQGSNIQTEENVNNQIILPPIEQNKNINNSNNDSDIHEQEKEKNHIEVQVDSAPKEVEDSKKVKELKEKIDRINKQRKYESENFPQETLEYDIKISNYNESINDITAKNNVLFAQLTKLQKRINLIFDINIKKSGIKDPVFYASNIKGLENVECWSDEDKNKKAI